MNKTTYSFLIDKDDHTVSFGAGMCKKPLFKIYNTTPDCLAEAYRYAAYYFLEAAHNVSHSRDFVVPVFDLKAMQEQCNKILHEYKPFLCEEAV